MPALPTHQVAPTTRVMTLALEGEIGQDEFIDVAQQLFKLVHRGVVRVVLDFTDVGHLDYRLVRPLIARAELLRRAGGDLKIAGLSPYLYAIFRSAGAHDAFDYFALPQDAAKAFDGGLFLAQSA